MAKITAKMVKELREKSGAGIMEAKKALTETDGNIEKAIEFLRKKGMAAAQKKAGRIAAEGLVSVSIDNENRKATVVEVNCETDFVGKNDNFKNFVVDIADFVNEKKPTDLDTLLSLKKDETTIEALQSSLVAKIGEKINIRRFKTMEGEFVAAYLHNVNNRVASLVTFKAEDKDVFNNDQFQAFAKDIAMQVTALSPKYLDKNQVDQDALEKEREILATQVRAEGKKEELVDKIVFGKLNKWYKDICLMDQTFFKEDKKSVTAVLKEKQKEFGTKIEIIDFVRYEVGEGLEKRKDNFAEEVAAELNK